jgi:hypothetical protein
VTIAKRPSVWGGIAVDVEVIWVKSEREYFCEKGWTGKSVICPSGNRVFNRSSWRRAFAHQREAHPVFDQRLGFGRQRDANWLQVSRAPFLQIKRAICAPG